MFNTFVQSRLRIWAEWRERRDSGGLGYPTKSVFVREPGSTYWTEDINSACIEMDKCVSALPERLKLPIMLEYTRIGTQQQKANRCGCCLRTYINRLDDAYRKLLGLLNDSAAGIPLPAPENKLEKIA